MDAMEPQGNDTTAGASMYLSFDNSTLSATAYKTFDTMTSTAMDKDVEKICSQSLSVGQNSTLEAASPGNAITHEISKLGKDHNDSLKVMMRKSFSKKMGALATSSPLRPVSKLLNEYKAFSSTPSKITKSVNGVMSDNASQAGFPFVDDKENEQPSEASVRTLSESTDVLSSSADTSKRKTPILPTSTKKAKAELAKTISEAIASLERAKSQALTAETPLKTGIPIAKNSNLKRKNSEAANKSQELASSSQKLMLNKSKNSSAVQNKSDNKSKEKLSPAVHHNKSHGNKKHVSLNTEPTTIIENISPPSVHPQSAGAFDEPKVLTKLPKIVVNHINEGSSDKSPAADASKNLNTPMSNLSKLMKKKLKISEDAATEKTNDGNLAKAKSLLKAVEDQLDSSQKEALRVVKKPSPKKRKSLGGYLKNKRLSVAAKTSLHSPVNKFNRKSLMPSRKLPTVQQAAEGGAIKKPTPRSPTSTSANALSGVAPRLPTNASSRRSVMPTTKKTNFGTSGIRRSFMPFSGAKAAATGNSLGLKQPRASMVPPSSNEAFKPPSLSAASTSAAAKKDALSAKTKLEIPTYDASTAKPSTSGAKDKVFTCSDCGSIFHIKSLMEAHRRVAHDLGVLDAATKKLSRQSTIGAGTAGHAPPSSNQCRYCDKKFALERTLHIHLMQNCPKIPAIDRRNLNFNEMDHVQKAETPVFSHASASVTVSLLGNNNNASKQNSVFATATSGADQSTAPVGLFAKPHSVAPKSASQNAQPKKKPSNALYRTPTKSTPCPHCSLVFPTLSDFVQHIEVHCGPLEDGEKASEEV